MSTLTKMRDALMDPETRDFVLTGLVMAVLPWVMFS